MAGKIEIYKKGCNVTITTNGTALATTTSTVHYMTVFNSQIRVGQIVNYSGVLGNAITVTAVSDESFNNNRRTKVTLSSSVTISANTVLTFKSLDNIFTNTGRVGSQSSFTITIERVTGRILSPNPSLNFAGVYSIGDYKVINTDTFENTTELIKRVYVVTHSVPLLKSNNEDIIYLKADTEVDLTGTQNKIYGYEMLVNPPGQSIDDITNNIASANKDLTSISFPSKKSINKKAERRLLVVYGDPGATFKLGIASASIALQHESSAVSTQTTINLSGSANAGVLSKGMSILSFDGGTVVVPGVKVVSKSTAATPDTVTLSVGQSVLADDLINFGYVLVPANTVRTLNSSGIYAEYINYPANDSTANIVFTTTISENIADSFVEFSTPSVTQVTSLATSRNQALFGVYAATSQRTRSKSSQSPVSSVISTGGGRVVGGQAEASASTYGS
tara:strand:+ start:207 stop:1553 length:1347 start_codon:yes stop_codon:yes gene_type:complete